MSTRAVFQFAKLYIGLTALGLALHASPAGATTWYVATNGNDATHGGTGGWGDAYLTISNAVAHSVDGDLVRVTNGLYAISTQITITNGITVRSENGADATIVKAPGGGASQFNRGFFLTNALAVVDGFTITNGYINHAGGNGVDNGGGVKLNAGTLQNCKVVGNRAAGSSGDARIFGGGGIGLHSGGGVVRNCLIAGNHVDFNGGDSAAGGGVWVGATGWRLENCTIVRNFAGGHSSLGGGGGVYQFGGAVYVTNCIIYYNSVTRGAGPNWLSINGGGYTCTTPTNGLVGPGNTAAVPDFVNQGAGYGITASNGDFRLLPASPCIDSGVALSSFTNDLTGTLRPVDGDGNGTASWDMGAYEAAAATNGALRFSFQANKVTGLSPLQVVFTATKVDGTDTNSLSFTWNLGNGVTNQGAGLWTVTNTYAAGDYYVTLTLSNASGEVVTEPLQNPDVVIHVAPGTVYVATNGHSIAPYDTWFNALTNIQSAIDIGTLDGTNFTTVIVSNGTYALTNQLNLTKGLTVCSVNGADVTILKAPGGAASTYNRCFYVSDPNAVVDGFTCTNGYINHALGYGTDCGGGVRLDAGTLQNCKVIGNRATGGSGDAGGYGGGGLGLHAGGGTVRNCLIANNHVDELGHDSGSGGGLWINGPWHLENCTVARNFAGAHASYHGGGGVFLRGGATTITNCIVYYNQVTPGRGQDNWNTGFGVNMAFSCTTPTNGLAGAGNTAVVAKFLDQGTGSGLTAAGGNYRLRPTSPCLDTGTALGGFTRDLIGTLRPQDGDGNGVAAWDMGAYEDPGATNGPLRFEFAANQASGLSPLSVVFTAARVSGADTNGLTFTWSFGDGTTNTGAGRWIVTNVYGVGTFPVSLTLSNGTGEIVTEPLQDPDTAIHVGAGAVLVATNGAHIAPFDTWAKAATNIQAAIDASVFNVSNYVPVFVSNGTYVVASQINVNKGLTLRSMNGPDVTIVQAPGGSAAQFNRGFFISDSNAVVDGFTITNGYISHATYATDNGGGVRLDAGTLQNCKVVGNRAAGGIDARGYGGGGIGLHSVGGLVRNCLIAGNQVDDIGVYSGTGGGIGIYSGTWRIEHCTVIRNFAGGNNNYGGGGGIVRYGGTAAISNCVVYYNSINHSTGPNWYGVDMSYSDTTPTNGLTGAGNSALFPDLVDGGTGDGLAASGTDSHLRPGSPCIDAGAALAGVTADLAGTTRPRDGDGNGAAAPDIGAYEALEPTNGPLRVSFAANKASGVAPLAVTFTVSKVAGANTNSLTYWWNLGNGTTNGANLTTVATVYGAGNYTVSLTVSNGLGEGVTYPLQIPDSVIRAGGPAVYVATNGLNQSPYDTWQKAATNIQAALNSGITLDGTNLAPVIVSNGVYAVSTEVALDRAITLRSLNGPDVTIVKARGNPSDQRCFRITDPGAVLDGFTVTNGYTSDCGAGIYMNAGTVQNCKVLGNWTLGSSGDSRFFGGGGLFCLDVGGGGGTIRNCLIAGNTANGGAPDGPSGGGVWMNSSTWHMENCTVVSNYAAGHSSMGIGAGVFDAYPNVGLGYATATNCIVQFNIARFPDAGTNWVGVLLGYSCTLPTNGLTGPGNITNDPQFVGFVNGNYRLTAGSPCVNAGTNLPWMAGALDLDRRARIMKGGKVDMGAYEWPVPPGTIFSMR